MNFNFGEVLTRAWQITWKYKVLWVFGILASCSRGNGGSSSSSSRGGDSFSGGTDQFGQWASENTGLVILFAVVALLLLVLFFYLGAIGRVGLIKATYQAEHGTEQFVLGELFSESMPYAGRVFGLSFAVGLIFLLLFVPLILMGFATAGLALLCILPLICILIPVSWVVNIAVEQANAAMVLEDLGIRAGFMRGWGIVRANLGSTLIMGLILVVISAILGLLIAVPILIVVLPAAIAYGNSQSNGALVLMAVCICLYLPIAIVLQGILVTYIQSAWALTFLRLRGEPPVKQSAEPEYNPPAPRPTTPVQPSTVDDNNKTFVAARPAGDNDKTFVAARPDENPKSASDSEDNNKTFIAKKPDA